MLGKELGKKHKDELIAFASRLKSCLLIGQSYRDALKKSTEARDKGQAVEALKAFESSLYSQDAWFRAAMTWLKSEAGQAFLKQGNK